MRPPFAFAQRAASCSQYRWPTLRVDAVMRRRASRLIERTSARGPCMMPSTLRRSSAVALRAQPRAQTPVERGDYLVNTHHDLRQLPHAERSARPEIRQGACPAACSFDEPPFTVTASNITPDNDTGIGNWTRRGHQDRCCAPASGRTACTIATVMPTGFYGIMTDARRRCDRRLSAHGQAGRATRCRTPIYKMPLPQRPVWPRATPIDRAPILNDKVEDGLLSRDHRALHGVPHADRHARPRLHPRLGEGGFEFPGPWGVSVSRNITSSKTKGIGAWTRRRDQARHHQGHPQATARKLKPPMGYPATTPSMTRHDLDAIVAYLRTVPAKRVGRERVSDMAVRPRQLVSAGCRW